MDNKIEVIGNTSDVLCYNLNKQFCSIKKLIITSEVFLKSFESKEILETILDLSQANYTNYSEILKTAIQNGVFTKKISSDANKVLTEKIQEFFNEMNVELQNYNFMSSINNTRFNITLRCDNFSITKYYQEKNTISSLFTQLLIDYLTFEVNEIRNNKLNKFQIEITISEDVFKHVYLKKEGDKLFLVSAFGFKKGLIHDYGIGSEFYISKGEEFHFYQNSQNYAVLRDQTKLKEQEIHEHEKILSNDELVLLNKNTKNIDDVLIEMYISPKGTLRITNVSILENPIDIYSKDGFAIFKSTNNYNKISLLNLRDEINEETPNPKYLLIRNHGEVQELFEDLTILRKIDGLIFTINFYTPLLELIGEKLNIDILFFKQQLQRSLETTINWTEFSIDGNKKENKEANPFNSIMREKNQQKDQMLERLKNVDLSTPEEYQKQRAEEVNSISNTTQKIISSPQSQQTNNGHNRQMMNNTDNTKKSALAFLADSVLNGPKPENKTNNFENKQTQNLNSSSSNPSNFINSNSSEYNSYNNSNNNTSKNSNYNSNTSQNNTYNNNSIDTSNNNHNNPQSNTYNNNTSQNNNQITQQENLNNQINTQFTNSNNNLTQSDNQNHPKTIDDFFNTPSNNNTSQFDSNLNNNYNQHPTTQYSNTDNNNNNNYNNTLQSNPYDPPSQNLDIQTQTTQHPQNLNQQNNTQNTKYDNVLAVKIITQPNFNNENLLINNNTNIEQTNQINLYMLISNENEIRNNRINYIIPISEYKENSNNLNQINNNNNTQKTSLIYLLNSPIEYFLIPKEKEIEIMININGLPESIIKPFLENIFEKRNIKISIMCGEEHLYYFEDKINKIENILIQNIHSQEQLNQIKTKVLKFEKTWILKNF